MTETHPYLIRFVLQAIDPATDCPVLECPFSIASQEELSSIVGVQSTELGYGHDLPGEIVEKIKKKYALDFDADGKPVRLRPWHSTDELPYQIHTGRELALMLQGTKPLAFFSHFSNEELLEEPFFQPHVDDGTFAKREFEILLRCRQGDNTHLSVRYVLYARPSEEWRIDSYILLKLSQIEGGWNFAMEWMEGLLLGYEAWQNRAFALKFGRGNGEAGDAQPVSPSPVGRQ